MAGLRPHQSLPWADAVEVAAGEAADGTSVTSIDEDGMRTRSLGPAARPHASCPGRGTRAIAAVAAVLLGLAAASFSASAQERLNVVATIKPVHALVAGVMGKTGTPRLLVGGAASPHTFSLKPSDAKALGEADVFIRVSEEVEPFTRKLVSTLPKKVQVVTLEAVPGMTLLPVRSGGPFEAHDHAGHDHGHKHGHGKAAKEDNDGHLWLDPANARLIVRHVAEVLAARRPADAATFKANADELVRRLEALDAELAAGAKAVAGRPIVVFHDAYQYFERRYGLSVVGSITVNPEVKPSAKRLSALRTKVEKLAAVCVLSEPQFDSGLVASVAGGTKARTGVVDPLGATIEPGPDLYFGVLRGLLASVKACAAPAS